MTYSQDSSATVNFVTNPAIRTATTGWTTSGTNTIARVVNATEGLGALPDELDAFVPDSLKCVYGSAGSMAQTAVTVTAAGPHSMSLWVWVPASATFATLTLRFVNFTGATGTTTVNVNLGLTDQWQRATIANVGIVSGDLVGAMQLFWQSTTPTAGSTVYLSAAQVEPLAAVTSYADGSMGARYSWRGTANASISDRAVLTDFGMAGFMAAVLAT